MFKDANWQGQRSRLASIIPNREGWLLSRDILHDAKLASVTRNSGYLEAREGYQNSFGTVSVSKIVLHSSWAPTGSFWKLLISVSVRSKRLPCALLGYGKPFQKCSAGEGRRLSAGSGLWCRSKLCSFVMACLLCSRNNPLCTNWLQLKALESVFGVWSFIGFKEAHA